jgi:lipoprotein-anchoring transpeptidase ErfK/SrfK
LTQHQARGVRPRYGRLVAASSALAITLVTLLGGLGVLTDAGPAAAADTGSGPVASLTALTVPDAEPRTSARPTGTPTPTETTQGTSSTALPADSGTGKRVVFDISDQRVWLVDADPGSGSAEVQRTYLVSGSLTDNLDPGTYEVYSRSRWAVGIDDSGVMQYFVRFTRGDNAAIGFHSIPTKDGRALQTAAQLGTPQSHGCIRQALPDAVRLWTFAPVGTKVVVTA